MSPRIALKENQLFTIDAFTIHSQIRQPGKRHFKRDYYHNPELLIFFPTTVMLSILKVPLEVVEIPCYKVHSPLVLVTIIRSVQNLGILRDPLALEMQHPTPIPCLVLDHFNLQLRSILVSLINQCIPSTPNTVTSPCSLCRVTRNISLLLKLQADHLANVQVRFQEDISSSDSSSHFPLLIGKGHSCVSSSHQHHQMKHSSSGTTQHHYQTQHSSTGASSSFRNSTQSSRFH